MLLRQRRIAGELMDDPDLDPSAHEAALRGLRRINAVSRTANALWPPIVRIAAAHQGPPANLLDVACGGGDVTIALARRARRRGLALKVQGCDISRTALLYAARRAAAASAPVRFFPLDACADLLPSHYDIIVSTLFLHHLRDGQIVTLLGKLAAGANHLLVSDLVRDPVGYTFAWIGTRLLSTSSIVRTDGMRSVRAALSLAEAQSLAAEAGLKNARFERRWPRRFLMSWSQTKNTAAGARRAV